MHILLTRPLEDCSKMILKFQSLGHKVSHLPLIRIEKIDYGEINFSEYSGIIFTSANAVKFLNIELSSLQLHYYLFLAMSIIIILISKRLEYSRLGRAWVAVREDEVAAKACGINTTRVKLWAFVLGASFGGSLGVTASSGPGIALKGEFLGLTLITELPVVIINVQRGGPSTGLPTKTEQSDLFQAVYGRNGDAPTPVVAATTPGDCFFTTYEACRIAVKYMTPIIVLTDGYLANGSEPWMIPNSKDLIDFEVNFEKENDSDEKHQPYKRNKDTLARNWAIPGTKGLEHRIGGIEKEDGSGNVSYDSDNHEHMTYTRAQKVANIANEIPPTEVYGKKKGDLLILSWGSTHGSCKVATEKLLAEKYKVGHVSLKWINPFPSDLGKILLNYEKVIIPEINRGQLRYLIRAEYLINAIGLNEIKGKPIGASTIMNKCKEILDG